MFKNLIKKLKCKKDELENISKIQEEKTTNFEILLSKHDNYYIMEISDYITIGEFVETMEKIDVFGINELIGNASLWNSGKQKVNKGIYYIINVEDKIYNIFIGEYIIIDERIKKEKITEERIIRLELSGYDYNLTMHNHNEFGSSYNTRFYHKSGFSMGTLDLSKEVAYEEINKVIQNLENIENINNIFDLNIIRNNILNDLNRQENTKKTKILL